MVVDEHWDDNRLLGRVRRGTRNEVVDRKRDETFNDFENVINVDILCIL